MIFAMKPMQSDDINVREPKRRFRFIHLPTNKIVRAETKRKAIKQLKSAYNIIAEKDDVRQARMDEGCGG